MNGGQDLGGMMGFGPVAPDPHEPVFHADWERRTFAMAMAMGTTGAWNIDMSRFARETLPPPEYMLSTYYAIWFKALEKLLVERGYVATAEVEGGRALGPAKPLPKSPLTPADVAARFETGAGFPAERPAPGPAAFAEGDAVRARNLHPAGHTRLPRYVRGRLGRVERVHGAHVFPDSAAHDRGEAPQWLYTVRFEGRELWGPEGDPNLAVSINAWESYLERP
jgi:nitrile hydratase subunit beta